MHISALSFSFSLNYIKNFVGLSTSVSCIFLWRLNRIRNWFLGRLCCLWKKYSFVFLGCAPVLLLCLNNYQFLLLCFITFYFRIHECCLMTDSFLEQADPRFLWNNYMLEVLIDNKVWFFAPLLPFFVFYFLIYKYFPNFKFLSSRTCSLIHTYFQLSKGISLKRCLPSVLIKFCSRRFCSTFHCFSWSYALTDVQAFSIFKHPLAKI